MFFKLVARKDFRSIGKKAKLVEGEVGHENFKYKKATENEIRETSIQQDSSKKVRTQKKLLSLKVKRYSCRNQT